LEEEERMQNYDDLIQRSVTKYFPECLGWRIIKAQVWAESEFNPHAISACGAQGLMQLMPATAKDLGVMDPFDPAQNVRGGVLFMRDLFDAYEEIPDIQERMRFAQAAYNGGRGNINKALAAARKAEGLPANFSEWLDDGKPAGKWQTWDYTKGFIVNCDVKQITGYVKKIAVLYSQYLEAA
jgi:membrane-bound lytic murein transglycosylase F